jgi:CRISPR-associated protein Cas5d
MAYGIKFRVWGDYACFSRPELKVERVSYDVITPSAARGILDCIYWKPAILWKIDMIHVINPIEFTNIRRNEVAEIAPGTIDRIMKKGCIVAPDVRHQRAALVLRNVEYVIEAHFDLTDKAGETDTVEKHFNIALRRLRKGQFFSKPFLGTREFSAEFEIIENDSVIPKSQLSGERDLGYMLYDVGHQIDEKAKYYVNPTFFRAVLNDGVLNLTDVEVVE